MKGVSTFYGKIQALNNVSLHVNSGEIVILVGANGAGKTTLLMTISADPRAVTGEIHYDGRDIIRKSTTDIMRSGIALVPEGRRVFSRLTVEDNLTMGGFFTEKHAFRQQLEPRLRERLYQYAGTMSGEEQQMLAIARALMSQPRLLLLDEPSLGLAPIVIQQLFATIGQLRREGGSDCFSGRTECKPGFEAG